MQELYTILLSIHAKMVEKSSNWYYYKAICFEMKERVTKKWIFIRRRGKDRKEPGADNRSAGVQCSERRDVGKEEPESEKLFHHRFHRLTQIDDLSYQQ